MFLQNTPPDDSFLSPHGNDGITVKARAQMMGAVACSKVSKPYKGSSATHYNYPFDANVVDCATKYGTRYYCEVCKHPWLYSRRVNVGNNQSIGY